MIRWKNKCFKDLFQPVNWTKIWAGVPTPLTVITAITWEIITWHLIPVVLCGDYERAYFEDGSVSEQIAQELGISEDNVYHHMKHHFQPLVQKSAAIEVALVAGQEINLLRSNAEKLNHKLSELLDEGTVHEDGFVRDAVSLHKEVRETVKDLLRFQDQWGAQSDGQQVNQTFNILQVELGKESPETWMRIKKQLQENVGV